MPSRLGRLATAAVIQLCALVLGHQLVYLARYGSRFGEALVHSGHGDAWTAAVMSSVALGVGLGAVAALRLLGLGALLRRSGSSSVAVDGSLATPALLHAWARLAPRVVLVQLVLLTVQENIERAWLGGAMPGPGILLSPEYAGGAWIASGVAILVSLVAALFEWRRNLLLARLRAARAPLARSAPARRPIAPPARVVESLLGRKSALRAPPAIGIA